MQLVNIEDIRSLLNFACLPTCVGMARICRIEAARNLYLHLPYSDRHSLAMDYPELVENLQQQTMAGSVTVRPADDAMDAMRAKAYALQAQYQKLVMDGRTMPVSATIEPPKPEPAVKRMDEAELDDFRRGVAKVWRSLPL